MMLKPLLLTTLLIGFTGAQSVEQRIEVLEQTHGFELCHATGGLWNVPAGACECPAGTEYDAAAGCTSAEPPPPPPPPPTSGLRPVMATPPGGSLEAFDNWVDEQCGAARADWPVVTIGPGRDFESTDGANMPAVAVVKIYHRAEPYPVLKLKGKTCVVVESVPGPAGELPVVGGVNATKGLKLGDPLFPGGIVIRGIQISGGHGVGVPNNRQFVAVEDSIIERSSSHGIITDDNAHHLYVRLLRNHWRDNGGDNAIYIDRVARADVIGNKCENPGGRHCIRVIAHNYHVEDNIASNVALDGTVTGKIGMHPYDLYNCGDGVVRNNIGIKVQTTQADGVFLYRGRTGFGYCDVAGKTEDGRFWVPMRAGSDDFLDPATWDDIDDGLSSDGPASRYAFVVRHGGNTSYTLRNENNVDAHVVGNSTRPSVFAGQAREDLKAAVRAFTTENPRVSGVSLADHCAALAALAPTPDMRWLFDLAWPDSQFNVCEKGSLPSYIPRPVPSNWTERQYLVLEDGNRAFEGDTMDTVVEVEPVLRLDDKRRVFDGPRPGQYVTRLIGGDDFRVVRVINGQDPPAEPPPPEDPPEEPEPPPTNAGPIGSMTWKRMPNSAQDTVFIPGVDDAFPKGWGGSWDAIQGSWNGGACADGKVLIHGGGHEDGLHNGVLAFDPVDGTWERLSGPGTWWTASQCPEGRCPSAAGECRVDVEPAELPFCRLFPDGSPAPGHTYYGLAFDGAALWTSGGSVWHAKAKNFPNLFRFDLATRTWSHHAHNPIAKGHGSLSAIADRLYYNSNAGFAIFDGVEWTKTPAKNGVGGQVSVTWDPDRQRIYYVGHGSRFWTTPEAFGEVAGVLPPHPVVEIKYPGALYYPPEGLVLYWTGGPELVALDTETLTWETFTPAGDPGPVLTEGALDRFSYCGGRIVLIDGHGRDAFVLE